GPARMVALPPVARGGAARGLCRRDPPRRPDRPAHFAGVAARQPGYGHARRPIMSAHDPMSLPLVGITACQQPGKHLPEHRVGEKYVACIPAAVGAVPMVIPALGPRVDPQAIVAHLDGLLVTGSPSNVEPHHYDGTPSAPGTLHDPARDATT